jgi:hypothetical protein
MSLSEAGRAPAVPRYKKDDKFLRGKNDRLFLDNDQNEVIRQHTGERLFGPGELRHWRLLLESRVAMLEKSGIPYFHLVPPNAHSVYSEDLPEHVRSHHTRPVLQLIAELREKRSFAKLIYPLDELLAAKPRLLYPKTDPHWSSIGAFVAYERLADEMTPVVHMHRVREHDLVLEEHMLVGELGFKVEPQQESTDVGVWVSKPTAYLVSDNCVVNTGTVVVTECPDAPQTTCVVLGDSFSDQLSPYLAASFGRLVYAYTPRVDYDFIREYEPDVVVSVLNERFMIYVPNDLSGPSLQDMVQQKLAHGLTREPRSNFKRRSAD